MRMHVPRIRFSLLGLFTAIGLFGAALACILKFGLSLPMVTIIWSILLLALMIAPVLAFVGVQHRRMFCAGFAWFGWMYILICFSGLMARASNSIMPSSPVVFPKMAIERGMFWAYKWIVPRESWILNSNPEENYSSIAFEYDSRIRNPPRPASPVTFAGGGSTPPPTANAPGGGFFSGTMPMNPALQQPHRIIPWIVCRDIGHALLAALWGILGGCLVSWIARRNAPRKVESATPTPL
ncbi:MAG: hypothetical protein K8R36_20725 [Planctomycetales bacterium]|nr:hypothetical protein [Planctomycetales bacterium]